MMAGYPTRLATNRSNPYIAPGGYEKLRSEGHLEVLGSYLCGNTPVPNEPAPPGPVAAAAAARPGRYYTYGDGGGGAAGGPALRPAGPLGGEVGQTAFSRLEPLP